MLNSKCFGRALARTKAASKSMLSIVLSLCLLAVMLPAGIGLMPASADAWNGTTMEPYVGYGDAAYGTQSNPYKIENAAQLAFLSKAVAMNGAEFEIDGTGTKYKAANKQVSTLSWYYGYYFEIDADIDLNNKAWTPIGSQSAGFSGNIEGNGHEIVGLNCTMTTAVGTGLIGAYNRGTIQNLHVEGAVNGPSHVGSFIGRMGALSNLINCSFSGTVTATANNSYVGGLAGWVQGDSILNFENCWTSGSVTGVASVGGLFGLSYTATTKVRVNNCYSTMTVTASASGTKAGGLAGGCVADTIIQNSHFSGTVNTVYPIAQTTNAITLNNVFYKAGSYKNTAAGTLTGAVEYSTDLDFVTASLNALAQTNGWASWSADTTKGYPVFETAPELTDLTVSSGLLTFDPLVRNYTLQISSESVALTPTFADGTTVTIDGVVATSGVASAPIALEDGASTVATIVATCGSTSWTYTVTITRNASIWDGTTKLPFIGYGDATYGTIENPYLISNAAQLAFLSATVKQTSDKVTINGTEYSQSLYKNKYFKLTADIDLNNREWIPIGKDSSGGEFRFAGNFDGDGYVIRNLTVTGDKHIGLFGYVNGAVIRDVTVYGTLTGAQYLGGIAGHSSGAIFEGCAFIGTIEQNNSASGGTVGGIVGYVRGSNAVTTVKNCYTDGTIISLKNNVGGLVGSTGGTAYVTVANSYSTMDVSRTGNTANTSGIAGLVGTSTNVNSTIANSFFAGTVNNGCPISGGIGSTTVFPTLTNVYYSEDSVNTSTVGNGTTGAVAKSATDFTSGSLTALLNSKVTGTNGYAPWMDGTAHPVFKPTSQLSNLTISNGKLTFDPATYEYNVTVRYPVETVTLTPSAADGYVITVNGVAVTGGTASPAIALTVNTVTPITVGVAPAATPTAVTEYIVNVKRQVAPPAGVWDGSYEPYASGNGSQTSPYEIANAAQLAFFAAMVNGETVVIGDRTYTAPEANYGLAYNADHFVLTADIVLNDISDIDTWATNEPINNWTPIGGKIGTSSRHFGGTLNGGGHTITGLYTKTDVADRGVGLFGSISTATVRDLHVEAAYVEGADYVGGFTGKIGDSSRLENCTFEGTVVSAGSYAGGLVGQILGSNITVANCYTEGAINGTKSLGGLIGRMAAGAASNYVEVKFSYSAMNVVSSADTDSVGGLVGSFGGAANGQVRLVGCHFAGTTNKTAPVIGLMEDSTYIATIENNYYRDTCCAAPAPVAGEIGKTAQEFASGTVADLLNQSVVGTTYWKTDTNKGYPVIVTVSDPVLLTSLMISDGALPFDPNVYLYTVYTPYKYSQMSVMPKAESGVTITVNGQTNASGKLSAPQALEVGVAKRFTIQLKRGDAITVYAVDIIRNEQTPDGVWDGSYEAYDKTGKKGETIENPVTINNEAQFAYLAAMVNGQRLMINGEEKSVPQANGGVVYRGVFFQITADLNMNSLDNYANWATEAPVNQWTPIGIMADAEKDSRMFGGVIDGDSHTISGVYFNDVTYSGSSGAGLFGCVNYATIRNLHVRSSYIKASQRIGGIVGRVRGRLTVQNCSFSGTVESNVKGSTQHSYVGGIIGDTNGKTTMTSCWSEGTLIGSMGTAGLIGGMYMSGSYYVENSYSVANILAVEGANKVAGLVGALSQSGTLTIRRCHFAGTIPTSTPIVGYATTQQSLAITDTYYMTGSFAAGTVDTALAGGAEEKSVQEFAGGTVTQLLNQAAAYGDFWNWKDDEKGYPISDGILLVTDYKSYVDDSEYNDIGWADKFVNKDGGTLIGGSVGGNGGSSQYPSGTGEKSLCAAALIVLLASAAAITFLVRRKRSAE